MFKYFLDRSDQGSDHCGGDHTASDLLVCLLNAPPRQHGKEISLLLPRMGLCFAQTWKEWFPSFRTKHGMLKQTSGGKGGTPACQVLEKRQERGDVNIYISHLLLIGRTRAEQALKFETLVKLLEWTIPSYTQLSFLAYAFFYLTKCVCPSNCVRSLFFKFLLLAG